MPFKFFSHENNTKKQEGLRIILRRLSLFIFLIKERGLFLHHLLAIDDDDTLIAVVNTLTGDVVDCITHVCAVGIYLADCRRLNTLEFNLVDIAVGSVDSDADDGLARSKLLLGGVVDSLVGIPRVITSLRHAHPPEVVNLAVLNNAYVEARA